MQAVATSLYVGAGAFVGANGRYWFGLWIQTLTGGAFPWHTLAINVTGSLLLGLFIGLAERHGWGTGWREFVAIGIMGGYTTFSTFSLETVVALHEGRYRDAGLYVVASVFASVGAVALGLYLAQKAVTPTI